MLRYAIVLKARPRIWLPLLFITLAAFLLRIFRLDHQSLWYDEAFSVFLARMNPAEITARTAADIQPPLYYYLLHFWIELAGASEFAVRFLSLFFGVLIVPLLFALARRLFDRSAAIFTALLALVSPLYLWYSQETRMYTLITFLGLLSSYALLRALDPPPLERVHASTTLSRRNTQARVNSFDRPLPRLTGEGRRAGGRWWIIFALTNIAAVYTHYFAFVLIAFQFTYALGYVLTRKAPFAIRPLLTAFAAILVAFVPWLPFMVSRLSEDVSYWRGALKLDEAVRHIFINFAAGESVLEGIAQYIAAGWLVILIVGLIAWIVARRKQATRPSGSLAFAILYLLIPLGLLLFLFSRNPKFNARYLMIASPGLLLLLGAGLGSLRELVRGVGQYQAFPNAKWFRTAVRRNARSAPLRRAFWGALLVVAGVPLLATSLYADSNAYFDPAFTTDFRGVAAYITAHARDDEAIVLTSGHMFPAFDYYYTAARDPELRLPDDPTLNTEHVLNYSAADDLNRVLVGRRGAWLVQWQDEVVDPNGFVPMLLSTRGTEEKLEGASFWQVKLRHWTQPSGFAPFATQPEIANTHEANFAAKNAASTFKLLGWSAAHPTSADQGATFTLYWQALDTTPDDYNVALRIVDAQGNFWGKLDRRPSGYNYPTMRWKKGETLFGEYTVPLLPGAPAGEYFATVTLFTASDQTGLDVLAPNGAPVGKSVKLGPIRVVPAEKQPSIVDLSIQHTLSTRVGPFTLLGYNLTREQASTGESIPLTLFWRAEEKPDQDYRFAIQFGDKTSAPQPLANASFPTSQWNAGEIVRGQYLIQVPPDASAGATDLQLHLSPNWIMDLKQPFTIEKTDRVFVEPGAQYKQEAIFGNNYLALVGYNLSAPEIKAGDTLTVSLNWKALGKMDKPYTVFVHLLDQNAQVVAQKDSQPLGGQRATPTWVEGEYLADSYALSLKPDTPPGEYRIEIGWYDASDPAFARLQVIDPSDVPEGDHVILNTRVEVK